MISPKAIEIIKELEGFSALEYTCVAGNRTIGYGHVIKPGESFVCGLSEKKAEELLLSDLNYFETALNDLVKVPLEQYQKDALLSFIFNIGVYAFGHSTLLKELNAGCYDQVSVQMRRWVYVNGKFCSGLMRRRQTEIAIFENKKRKKKACSL